MQRETGREKREKSGAIPQKTAPRKRNVKFKKKERSRCMTMRPVRRSFQREAASRENTIQGKPGCKRKTENRRRTAALRKGAPGTKDGAPKTQKRPRPEPWRRFCVRTGKNRPIPDSTSESAKCEESLLRVLRTIKTRGRKPFAGRTKRPKNPLTERVQPCRSGGTEYIR